MVLLQEHDRGDGVLCVERPELALAPFLALAVLVRILDRATGVSFTKALLQVEDLPTHCRNACWRPSDLRMRCSQASSCVRLACAHPLMLQHRAASSTALLSAW